MSDTLTLTRFVPVAIYEEEPSEEQHVGLFVDCETTGLDPAHDEIIALAITPFIFTADGRVIRTMTTKVWYEQPSKPLLPEIVTLTGLTDEMLAGKRIADGEVMHLASHAVLIVAHHAEFDRQVLERRLHFFEHLRWGCSDADIPWREEGYRTTKLEWLLFKHCQMFHLAHDAARDCEVGVHLLSTKLPSGKGALACLLDAVRATWCRMWAVGAAYDTRFALKARGYRWNSGEDGRRKAWYRDVRAGAQFHEERQWLEVESRICTPQWDTFNSLTRFSNRVGKKARREEGAYA